MIVLGYFPSGSVVGWDEGKVYWLDGPMRKERAAVERALSEPMLVVSRPTAGVTEGRLVQPGTAEHAIEAFYSIGLEVFAR